jgi:ribosomal protein S12 methylthiotransferase accessory factor YcaO
LPSTLTALAAVANLVEVEVARAAGITRVARVTGLDDAGVEVACAVRPAGHVLQVTQGKGATFELAVRSAVFEAYELWAAEHPLAAQFTWATAHELTGEVWERATPTCGSRGWWRSEAGPECGCQRKWCTARQKRGLTWARCSPGGPRMAWARTSECRWRYVMASESCWSEKR